MTKVQRKTEDKAFLKYLCQKNEIKRGQSKKFSISNNRGFTKDIAVFNFDGKFYALSNVCAHKGGPLNEGMFEKYLVTCPWHGWKYDVRTGNPPHEGGDSVDCYTVTVIENKLYADFRPAKIGTKFNSST